MPGIRPKGLKYKIKVRNKGWFKKGQKFNRESKPYFDKSIGYWKISIKGKEMKYHRYVMENYLGRKLSEDEVIHHIDNDIHNNDISNLELFENKSEHLKYHWKTTRLCHQKCVA